MPGPASPVFDSQGRAIGMVNIGADATILLNDPRQPLGAAANPARAFVPSIDFLDSLKSPPTVDSPVNLPTIGVAQLSGLSKELAEAYDLKGKAAVQIGDIVPGRPAERAGLKAGMVITELNGQPLERGDQPDETWQIFLRKLQRMKAGDKVTLTVIPSRGAAPQQFEVTLEDRPKPANKAKRFFAEDLGFSVRELVFNDTYERKLPADQKGVLVAFVRQQSSAANARLQMADLVTQFNGKPVESLEQFQADFEEFRKSKPREALMVEVLRGANTSIIRIEPPQ
jgi:S1-C subfamily serine protease